MQVDLKSLGTFNRIGKAGATRAADALATLTETDTAVETTVINFGPVEHVGGPLGDADTRVAIEFDGAIDGRALLVFDESCAEYVLEHLSGAGEPDRTYLNEVANIMTSSFIDGWAANLDDTVDIAPPTALDDDQPLVPDGRDVNGSSFVFKSTISIGQTSACDFYLVPAPTSFIETLREDTRAGEELAVDIDELTAFLQLTAAGAETVADQLATMTGVETEVTVSHLNFVPVESVPATIDDGTYTGTVFQFEGPMDGYLAILFDSASASEMASSMLPGASDDEMVRSAIEELGNITASGFIDGWANALGTTIDHSVPDFVDDMGSALLESIAARLGQTQEYAYVFDVVVTASEPMACRVFAFPEEDGLRDVIASLGADIDVEDVERI